MTINKKLLQVFSALLILIYHVWMPVGSGIGSQFIIRAGYIGVDMFFFLAAYSLADKDLKYSEFIRSRFGKIYLKFLLFAVVAALYKGWSFKRLVKVLLFAEFFERGGGSFLWFIPAIMIFYLLYPLYLKLDEKRRVWYILAGWLAFSLVSQHIFGYTAIFIFTNRIPVMLAGSAAKKLKMPWTISAAMIPAGLVLLYFFGFKMRLNVPIKDLYFVTALPLTLGLAWLSGLTVNAERSASGLTNKLVNVLGSCTLELYALQVIFGTVAAKAAYDLLGMKLAANLVTVAVIWLAAIIVEKGFRMAFRT